MKRSYVQMYRGRIRFRVKVPKTLWDCLPKIIARDLKGEYQEQAEERCLACGKRLKDLFERASKGMLARTILNALVNEICNEELYRPSQLPAVLDPEKPIPAHPDLLSAFLGKLVESLNVSLKWSFAIIAVTLPRLLTGRIRTSQ